ncbi:MAG: ATP-binding protein [Nitrospirae bacterium]|nr:ATP-binding protein [Nitrospirota bacterium]MCL5423114.1 ATP-binding protein [Nitrospirota bacterium]
MDQLCGESPQVGKLITSREHLQPDVVVRDVADRFFKSSELDALALVEGRNPLGLVTRPKFFFTVFRRYGFELYGRKPIITIADTAPLLMHEDERLDVAIDKALERPPQDVYDDIVVVNESGSYAGLLSVKQMVIQQSTVLANNIIQKEMVQAKAKEIERMSELRSRFIAHVTHELRSPVNAIIGLAELIQVSSRKGYMEQMKDRLALLMSSATNLRAIVTNILDLSKIEAGKMEVITEQFNVVTLLNEAAETTRVLVGNKPVNVEVIAHEDPLFMVSDPVKIRQILTNLLSNAAKFTEKGKILISLGLEGSRVRIVVSDTGIGIRENEMDKLFVAFSQLEDTMTKRHEGTGLGLTITKNLLTILGGKITVASNFGEGTSFTVFFPLNHMTKEDSSDGRQERQKDGTDH